MVDEVVQLVVGHPHRSAEVLGLRRRHRGRADAVGEHACSEQGEVAELAQQHDVVDRLDRAEPVDELVEIEAIDRYRSSIRFGEARQQSSGEQQPRRSIGELEQRFDVEHREPTARPGPLVDPVARRQLVGGVVSEHREEQQRRYGDDLGRQRRATLNRPPLAGVGHRWRTMADVRARRVANRRRCRAHAPALRHPHRGDSSADVSMVSPPDHRAQFIGTIFAVLSAASTDHLAIVPRSVALEILNRQLDLSL